MDASLLQFQNRWGFIVPNDDGRSICVRAVQSLNEPYPMDVTVLGMEIEVSEMQLLNDSDPIDSRSVESLTVVRDTQFEKAFE